MKAATEYTFPLCQQLGISIHAAREGGDVNVLAAAFNMDISIHAAREGGDMPDIIMILHTCYFNPRRP